MRELKLALEADKRYAWSWYTLVNCRPNNQTNLGVGLWPFVGYLLILLTFADFCRLLVAKHMPHHSPLAVETTRNGTPRLAPIDSQKLELEVREGKQKKSANKLIEERLPQYTDDLTKLWFNEKSRTRYGQELPYFTFAREKLHTQMIIYVLDNDPVRAT